MASEEIDLLPIVVEYKGGTFIPKHNVELEEGWTGQILLKSGTRGELSFLQKESLISLVDDIEKKDSAIQRYRPRAVLSRGFSLLFVDLSAWIAFIEPEHPDHQEAVSNLLGTESKVLITGDHTLAELSRIARKSPNRQHINKLIWLLWSGQAAALIKTESVEQDAWNVYVGVDDERLTFYDCITAVLVAKYKLDTIVLFSEYLKGALPPLLEKYRQTPITSFELVDESE